MKMWPAYSPLQRSFAANRLETDMPRNQPHRQPADLLAIDYSSLTMDQRHALVRAVIRRAHDERDQALRAMFAGLARSIRGAFARLGGCKHNRAVVISRKEFLQV
jgi:hypothetical protein